MTSNAPAGLIRRIHVHVRAVPAPLRSLHNPHTPAIQLPDHRPTGMLRRLEVGPNRPTWGRSTRVLMPTPPDIQFDRFYKHDELTALLRAYTEAYPAFAALESIGQSHEGREIWCLTITNSATGAHDTKPAQYIDGNMHAGEVTGSAAALYTA